MQVQTNIRNTGLNIEDQDLILSKQRNTNTNLFEGRKRVWNRKIGSCRNMAEMHEIALHMENNREVNGSNLLESLIELKLEHTN